MIHFLCVVPSLPRLRLTQVAGNERMRKENQDVEKFRETCGYLGLWASKHQSISGRHFYKVVGDARYVVKKGMEAFWSLNETSKVGLRVG
jgi:hypothetical protein